jgi:hypothetical protein
MYKYKITYQDKTTEIIRANSPKEAWNLGTKGLVTSIKYIGGK